MAGSLRLPRHGAPVVDPFLTAMTLAGGLIAFGAAAVAVQVRGLRRLHARKHVPSDEFAYLRSRHRRRILTGLLLVAIGGHIAAAYLTGMEGFVDALGERRGNEAKPAMAEAEKQVVRVWGVFWIWVVLQAFALIGLALTDAVATRRFWLSQYRQLREEHHARLRRDLAVHQQSKPGKTRIEGYGGRFGGPGEN